jgi:hypothetical protein
LLVTELEEIPTSLVFSLLDGDGVGNLVGGLVSIVTMWGRSVAPFW